MKYIIKIYHNGELVEVTETTNKDFIYFAYLIAKKNGYELVINIIDENSEED